MAASARGRLNNLLKLYDFPDATQTSPGRDLTTTPLQQLFVMNGAFMREQAAALAKTVEDEPDAAAKAASSVSQDSCPRPHRQRARSRSDVSCARARSQSTPKCCSRPTRRSSGHDAPAIRGGK